MLEQISAYLEAQGIGTADDICIGLMPDKPDDCIALFEYAGSPIPLHWAGEYPGLQVRVRGSSYSTGRDKIGAIVTALHGLHDQVLAVGESDGTRYLLIRARGTPELLNRDASDRVEFVVNFEIIKERE